MILKELFTWWNSQTLGTRIWTYFNGILIGTDQQGNKYYQNKNGTKRWVIYSALVESTLVNPQWNNWLRFTSSKTPIEDKMFDWQKEHSPNMTGTSKAYEPMVRKDKNHEYKKWSPKN